MLTDRYSILVIEDDLELTALLHFALARHGYTVHTAVAGDEGLSLWRRIDPDLVLVDVESAATQWLRAGSARPHGIQHAVYHAVGTHRRTGHPGRF